MGNITMTIRCAIHADPKKEPHVRGCPDCGYLEYEATGGYDTHGYDYFEPFNPDNLGYYPGAPDDPRQGDDA